MKEKCPETQENKDNAYYVDPCIARCIDKIEFKDKGKNDKAKKNTKKKNGF